MPAKSEKQRRFMGAVMSYEKGETPENKASQAVKAASKGMTKSQIADFLRKESKENDYNLTEEEIMEITTSASSGSYQTAFPTNMINKNKNMGENIELSLLEIEQMVKQVLLYEEVYSEKVKLTYSETKGKTSGKLPDNGMAKAGKSASVESKKNSSKVEKDTKASVKNNLKDSNAADVNKNKKQNEEQRIEAQQGGMQDLQYDHITDADKARFKKQTLGKKSEKGDNSVNTGVNQQIIDDAKKRGESRKKGLMALPRIQHGSNIFVLPSEKSSNTGKSTAFENTNKMKKYTFENKFSNEKQMLSKIPMKAKIPMNIFEMFDGEAKYKVRWEGDEKNGCPVILEAINTKEDKLIIESFDKTVKFKTQTTASSKKDEHSMLKSILDMTRDVE